MADNDDDSWEAAAQAALNIHRRVASAVRDRYGTTGGTTRRRKVVRSSKATSGSMRLNGKTRPTSAPVGGFQRRSSYSSYRTPSPMLVPSLEGIPTSSISLAELEACATLPRRNKFDGDSSPGASPKHSTMLGKSKSAGLTDRSAGTTIDGGARCPRNSIDYRYSYGKKTARNRDDIITAGQQQAKSSKIPPQLDVLFDRLERLGPTATAYTQAQLEPHGAASPATLTLGTAPINSNRARARARKAVDDSRIAALRHRRGSDGGGGGGGGGDADAGGRGHVQDLDGCRVALAEHLAARKRENELGRSDISIRFLREHARKTLDEDNTFVRALRTEVKAMEDIQLENIQRATRRCRDDGAGFLYLPHRVNGKLHVLKIDSNIAGGTRLGDEHETSAGPRATTTTATLESYGKVLSVKSFMKEEVSRLKKEPAQSRNGVARKNDKLGPTSAIPNKGHKTKGEQPGKVIMQGRPSAVDTCRDLHRLIRDTAGLVEALTAQAAELEGQGWNREPG